MQAHSPARKQTKANLENIYERLVQPERFEEWWTMYRRGCQALECSAGDKRSAADHWHRLERQDVDLDQVIAATTWDISNRVDLKLRGRFARYLPHGCRYLAFGYWETALESMQDEEG